MKDSQYGFTPDPGERTLRVIHRHPVTLVPAFLAAAVMIVLGFVFIYFGSRYPDAIPHAGALAGILALLLCIFGVVGILVAIYVYRRNVLIFTNIHLIQSEQIGLFNHRISQVDFRRVQDVSGRKAGIWESIFNFGNVEVQSAGEQEKFIFSGAPSPAQLADDALQTRDICIHDLALRDGMSPADTATGPARRSMDIPEEE